MNNRYYDRLFKRILNETLEERANSLVNTLKLNKKSEFDYVQEDSDDFMDMGKFNKYRRDPEYKSRKDARRMADKDMSKHFKKPGDPWSTDVKSSEDWPKHKLPYDTKFNFDELLEDTEVCNECGMGTMKEGECNECGYKKMSMKEGKEVCNECGMGTMKEGECNECGYIKEIEKVVDEGFLSKLFSRKDEKFESLMQEADRIYEESGECQYVMAGSYGSYVTSNPSGKAGNPLYSTCDDLEDFEEQFSDVVDESKKLSKGQKYIARQAEPKDKIDAKDFAKLRSKKTETKESGFPDLSGDNEVTKKDILIAKGVLDKKGNKIEKKQNETFYRIYSGKESAVFTESEVIDMIEELVKEEKQKFRPGQTPAGYSAYEKAVKQSKKENDKYINSVLQKLKGYTKPGSETTYDMNPEDFPKGNGEFKESEKKAYSTTEEGTDWNYKYAGQMVPDFDDPHPDKKRFKKQIEGSAENANVQGWGNSVKTKTNSKFAKIFDEDPLGKAKDDAYQRASQPVTLVGKGKLKEDFDRIKELIKYNDKTQ